MLYSAKYPLSVYVVLGMAAWGCVEFGLLEEKNENSKTLTVTGIRHMLLQALNKPFISMMLRSFGEAIGPG